MNALDLMQNTSIIYHSESVLEMQFMCLVLIGLMPKPDAKDIAEGKHDSSLNILWFLVFEHIFSYCSGLFRTWEVSKYGQMDVNGILRARREDMLKTVEIFIDCIIFGYSINHLVNLSEKDFHDLPYIHYWIIIDCILMFFTLAYVYVTQLMIVNSEITKNIFSMYFLQLSDIRN